MIKTIEMKNFKCFDCLQLSLAGLTILAGGNACLRTQQRGKKKIPWMFRRLWALR